MQNTESAIDLTLTFTAITGISTWEVLTQSTVGSDHYPTVIRIGVEIQQDGSWLKLTWMHSK